MAVPLYQEIAAYVESGVAEGRFTADRRLPSDMELARKFATSRPTVVRAMLELQHRGLIERRAGSGTYLRPTAVAVATPPTTVGIIAEGLEHTEIMAPICEAIGRQCAVNGIGVYRGAVAGVSDTLDSSNVIHVSEDLIARGVSGVFFAPLELPDDRTAVNQRVIETLTAAGVQVVLLDRDLPEFPGRSGFDLVGIDNFAAGYELGRHLLGGGRCRLAFIARPRYPSTTDLRLAGLRESAIADGIDVRVQIGEPGEVDFIRALLEAHCPDAIVCSNDRTAALLMQSLTRLGIRVPADVAVAGFDDVRYATLLSVPLSTMRQPCADIGAVAVDLMADRLSGRLIPPRAVTLRATLIARDSTARA